MSWAIGYDTTWSRDIGYGVPAFCDHPGCQEEIDRGLAHVCGGEPYGGDRGCGLYFCEKHHMAGGGKQLCGRCERSSRAAPYAPSREHPRWLQHKLFDESWAQWRTENIAGTEELRELLSKWIHVYLISDSEYVAAISPEEALEYYAESPHRDADIEHPEAELSDEDDYFDDGYSRGGERSTMIEVARELLQTTKPPFHVGIPVDLF